MVCAMCSPEPPTYTDTACSLTDLLEQVRLVEAFQPECQCGTYALSTGAAVLCRKPSTPRTPSTPSTARPSPLSSVAALVPTVIGKQGEQLNWEKARVETLELQAQLLAKFKATGDSPLLWQRLVFNRP